MSFFLPMWAIWSLLAMIQVAEASFGCDVSESHPNCKTTDLRNNQSHWVFLYSVGITCPDGLVAKSVKAEIYDDDGDGYRDDKCTRNTIPLIQNKINKRWRFYGRAQACECSDFAIRLPDQGIEYYVWLTVFCGKDDSTRYWSCNYTAGRCLPKGVYDFSTDFDFSKNDCFGRPAPHALSTFKCGSESSHENFCMLFDRRNPTYFFKNFTVRCPGYLEAKRVQVEIRDYGSQPGKPDAVCTKKPVELIQDGRDKTWRTPKDEAVAVCGCAKGRNERANYYVWTTVHCGRQTCQDGAGTTCKFSGGKCIPNDKYFLTADLHYQYIISGDFDFSTQKCKLPVGSQKN